MKFLYLYLKSDPKLATLCLGVLLVATTAIALEVQWIFHSLATLNRPALDGQSKTNHSDPLSAALTMPQGLQQTNAMANNPLAADPKIVVIMAQFHLGAKAASYIAQAKFEVISQNDTGIHFVATFPDKIIIDETATIAADATFTPTPADLERSARTGSKVHGPKLTLTKLAPKKWSYTLQYHVPYNVMSSELRQKLQPASNHSADFFDLAPKAWADGKEATGEGVISIIANYTSEAYKDIDFTHIKNRSELELEGIDNAKSYGADVPLALFDFLEDAAQMTLWQTELSKLKDCAKNPTNPLTQKAQLDPTTYKNEVVDQVGEAQRDVAWTAVPTVSSDVANYVSHFLPFGSGIAVGLIFGTQDEAISQYADGRIDNAKQAVVPCEERPSAGARFEYVYHHERSGAYVGTVDGNASGDFDISADPYGVGVYGGEGSGKFEWNEHGRDTVTKKTDTVHRFGDVEVNVAGNGPPRAATLKITIHGEQLTDISSCTGCQFTGPTHQEGTNSAITKVCTFPTVDLAKGGSYTADADLEPGAGKCKITLPAMPAP